MEKRVKNSIDLFTKTEIDKSFKLKVMQKLSITSIILIIISRGLLPLPVNAGYWLVIGSYRQGPGGRPEVSGITSPSVYAIPMKTLKDCKKAGEEVTKEIYKPVWQFDNRWTCIFDGNEEAENSQ